MKNNTENDLKEIEELRKRINFLKDLKVRGKRTTFAIKEIVAKVENKILALENRAKEIAKRNIFKGGCGTIIDTGKQYADILGIDENLLCGDMFEGIERFCPDCERKQKIQKIYGEITNEM